MIVPIGSKWVDRKEYKVYLLCGSAWKNGTIDYLGEDKTPVGRVSVLAGETMSGKKLYVTVNIWGNRVGLAIKTKRFDRVVGIGAIRKTKSKTGTIYYAMNCEYFNREPKADKMYAKTPTGNFDIDDWKQERFDEPF